MKLPRFLALTVLLTAAGCNGDPAPAPMASNDDSTSATPAPDAQAFPHRPGIELVSKVAPGKGTAVAVRAGQIFSGKYVIDRDGAVTAFGVRIGTYHGKADGSLALKLCANTTCRDAEMPLTGAKDNAFLFFTLPQPLQVASGTTLDYSLTRSSNDPANRVAVWVYPKPAGHEGIVDPEGKAIEAVGRLSIRLQ